MGGKEEFPLRPIASFHKGWFKILGFLTILYVCYSQYLYTTRMINTTTKVNSAIVSVMISLLVFCVLFCVWVYLILEPLTLLWASFCLWFGNHVVSKRDHATHVHVWTPDPVLRGKGEVCQLCGKLRASESTPKR